MEVENVANPIRHDSGARTGRHISMQIIRIPQLQRLIVHREVGHIDARIRASYSFHRGARARKTLVHNLENLALLRVHVGGLKVVDVKEGIVKLSNVLVDKIATGDICCAASVALGVVETVDVISIGWDGSVG